MYGKIKVLQPYLLPYSYSLFEPNSRTLAEYGARLEKAILRDSEWIIHISLQTNMHMQRYMGDLLPWPMIYMYVKMCAQLILSCLQQL